MMMKPDGPPSESTTGRSPHGATIRWLILGRIGTLTAQSKLLKWVQWQSTTHWIHSCCTLNCCINHESDAAAERALHNLLVSEPTPSMNSEDVVYLMARVKFLQHKAWVLAVDMRNNTLRGVAEFGIERERGACVIYRASSIFFKYVNLATTPGNYIYCSSKSLPLWPWSLSR